MCITVRVDSSFTRTSDCCHAPRAPTLQGLILQGLILAKETKRSIVPSVRKAKMIIVSSKTCKDLL